MMAQRGLWVLISVGIATCTQAPDDTSDFSSSAPEATTGQSSTGESPVETDSATSVADGGAPASTSSGAVADGGTSTSTDATTSLPADGGSSCGNGAIDPGEQCDGADLQGFDCSMLGMNGGTLACDPLMCTFDTQMCTSTPGGTSG